MMPNRNPLAEALAMLAGMMPGQGQGQRMGQMRRPAMPGQERIMGMADDPSRRQTMGAGRAWTVPPAFANGAPNAHVPFAAPPPAAFMPLNVVVPSFHVAVMESASIAVVSVPRERTTFLPKVEAAFAQVRIVASLSSVTFRP